MKLFFLISSTTKHKPGGKNSLISFSHWWNSMGFGMTWMKSQISVMECVLMSRNQITQWKTSCHTHQPPLISIGTLFLLTPIIQTTSLSLTHIHYTDSKKPRPLTAGSKVAPIAPLLWVGVRSPGRVSSGPSGWATTSLPRARWVTPSRRSCLWICSVCLW